MRRVVITGIGAITPIGNNAKSFWDNLISNKCGIEPISFVGENDIPIKLAAEVKEPDFSKLPKRDTKFDSRFTNFARIASIEAWQDASLAIETEKSDRIGVYISTSIGGPETLSSGVKTLEEKGASRISPFFLQSVLPNTAAAKVSIDIGAKGSSMCHVAACASGSISIGEAFLKILDGSHDIFIAGASDASITPLTVSGFAAMQAIYVGDDIQKASIPFDKRRSGFVIGEGAGILVLEELSHAQKRGAKIYAEIIGYNNNSDAFNMVSPDYEGAYSQKTMQRAIEFAGIKPKDIDYINAHGTSTYLGDKTEAKAIKQIWGQSPLASSIKGQIGHLLSASGAVEAIATTLSLKNGIIPGTAGFKQIDAECDLNIFNKPKRQDLEYAISNSFGFGGHNSCLVFKKWRGR